MNQTELIRESKGILSFYSYRTDVDFQVAAVLASLYWGESDMKIALGEKTL